MWRDLEYKNFHKSLDHQGINFKLSDRKHTSPKNLLSEIEILLKDQREKDSSFQNRYQMDYVFKDTTIYADCFTVLECTMDNASGITQNDDDRIRKELISGLLMSVFFVDTAATTEKGKTAPLNGLGITEDAKMGEAEARATYSFYTNTNIYVLIRLFQVL